MRLKTSIGLTLCLVTTGVFATSTELRFAVLEQLRAIAEPLFEQGDSTAPHFDTFYAMMVENLPIQQRAERALEMTINRYQGAAEYVLEYAQTWRPEVKSNERLTALITTAINAPRIETRMAGFELHLAQYDLDKTSDEVNRLIKRWVDDPVKTGPWALWSMAAIGARGVERERVFEELLSATIHDNGYVRRWAVDALAKFGGTEIIDPLLDIAQNDTSPVVQERAFCGLAQSGTLHIAERYHALPGLLAIAQNDHFNQQIQAWTYQALREITSFYDVPSDASSWQDVLLEADLL